MGAAMGAFDLRERLIEDYARRTCGTLATGDPLVRTVRIMKPLGIEKGPSR
jgi:hypothetical protein